MPVDPRKRQKKQEQRAAKRKAKQHQLAREKHAGLPERMTSAARFPVLESWASETLWTQGLGHVCLSRQLPNGFVAYALFLVDRYCLGVKDALATVAGRFTYDSRMRQLREKFPVRELSPATVRRFVEDAVDYARGLGFHPHADYHKAKPIFGTIDPNEATETLEFGKDGKPFFIAGPHDTPERCSQILATLQHSCGPDGSDYLIPLADPGRGFPGSLRGKEIHILGPGEAGSMFDEEFDAAEELDEDDTD